MLKAFRLQIAATALSSHHLNLEKKTGFVQERKLGAHQLCTLTLAGTFSWSNQAGLRWRRPLERPRRPLHDTVYKLPSKENVTKSPATRNDEHENPAK